MSVFRSVELESTGYRYNHEDSDSRVWVVPSTFVEQIKLVPK